MEILPTIIGGLVVAVILGITGLAWRRILSWLGHPTVEERITHLEKAVGRIADSADRVLTTDNKQLKAEYQEARILQLEGYRAQSAHKQPAITDRFTKPLALAVTTFVGALGAIWIVVTLPVRWWTNRRKPLPATRKDIQRLVAEMGRPAWYVDGLPLTRDGALRAAFGEGRRLQEEGYEAQSRERHSEAIDRFTRALALAENDSQRAALHNLRGNSYSSISQYNEAQADYEETLILADSIPDATEAAAARANALGNLGNVCGQRGDLDKAEEHHQQALEIYGKIGNRLGEANQLSNLGIIYGRRGRPDDLDKAEHYFQQALEIHREIGNRLGEAQDLGNLGNVYGQRDELDKAEEHHKQALKTDRDIGNRLGEAQDLGNLGLVYGRRGEHDDLDKAEHYFQQALEVHREIGNRLGEAIQLGNLGLVYLQRGELDKAKEYLQQAQAIYRQIGAGGEGPENVRKALEELEELERQQQERQQQERGKKQPPED